MSSQSSHETFSTYLQRVRFGSHPAIERVVQEVEALRSGSEHARALVFNSPYPPSERPVRELIGLSNDVQLETAGQGTGKTEVLRLIAAQLEQRTLCRPVLLADLSDNSDASTAFFTGVLLDALAGPSRRLAREPLPKRAWGWLVNRLARVAILINVAVPSFAAFGSAVVAWAGIQSLSFFTDQGQQATRDSLLSFVREQKGWVLVIAGVLGIVWMMHAWASLRRKENAELLERFKELGASPPVTAREQALREDLAADPARFLRRFAPARRPLVLLIDDLDAVDSLSFTRLMQLYQAARSSADSALYLVLGYNPRNPVLYQQAAKATMRRSLEPMELSPEEGWRRIELLPPTLAEIRRWLIGHYDDRDGRVDAVLRAFGYAYPLIRQNPGLLLAFFIRRERQLGAELTLLNQPVAELMADFEGYLHRDRRAATEIVQLLREGEAGAGAVEMLKYVLAFQRTSVPRQLLHRLMADTAYTETERYELRLTAEETNLLARRLDSDSLEFRFPYMRILLDTGWGEWRNTQSEYVSRVFAKHAQSLRGKQEEDADLALVAHPADPATMRLAIDVLFRKAEYYYKFAGAADIGTALRYGGLERGGALSKWFSLVRHAQGQPEGVWHILRWRSSARLRPNRGSQEVYPEETYAPAMVLTIGRLYWMSGNSQMAEELWSTHWPGIVDLLEQESPPRPEDVQRLQQTDAEIRIALAELLYCSGRNDGWERSIELCEVVKAELDPRGKAAQRATMLRALIAFYRHVGPGNALLNCRLIQSEGDLGVLTAACKSLPTNSMAYVRLLGTYADGLWQLISNQTTPLPLLISLDQLAPHEANASVVAHYADVVERLLVTLRQIHAQRTGSRSKRRLDLREDEAELLFWEARQVLLRGRQLRYYIHQELTNQSEAVEVLGRNRPSERIERLTIIYSKALRIRGIITDLFGEQLRPDQIYELLTGIEELHLTVQQIEQGAPPSNNREARRRQAQLVEKEREQRELLEKLFIAAWKAVVRLVDSKLRLAEAIYRDLGHRIGLAEVGAARTLLFAEHDPLFLSPERPSWLYHVDRFLARANDNEGNALLGYHLDQIVVRVYTAEWASHGDLFRQVDELLRLQPYVSSASIGLPGPLSFVVHTRLGGTLGNIGGAELEAEALKAMDAVSAYLEGISAPPEALTLEAFVYGMLNIYWWRAELLLRSSYAMRTSADRERLEQAAEAALTLLAIADRLEQQAEQPASTQRRTSRHKSPSPIPHERLIDAIEVDDKLLKVIRHEAYVARSALAKAREAQGQEEEAFIELEKVHSYFSKEDNLFWRAQSLSSLVSIGLGFSPDDRKAGALRKRTIEEYLPRLVAAATELRNEFKFLNSVTRQTLQRIAVQLGGIYQQIGEHHNALEWFSTAFDALLSLGLNGAAVMLDAHFVALYERLRDREGLQRHRERILDAVRSLDPTRERASLTRVGEIARRYLEIDAPVSTQLHSKQEILDQARNALHGSDVDAGLAITILEQGLEQHPIEEREPDYIDLDLLQQFHYALTIYGDLERAGELEHRQARIRDVIQSRDYLALAEHYRSEGGDYAWALKIAARVDHQNEYARRAQVRLRAEFDEAEAEGEALIPSAEEAGLPSAPETTAQPGIMIADPGIARAAPGAEPSEPAHAVALTQPSLEFWYTRPIEAFDQKTCYELLLLLERELRALIVQELSAAGQSWWKQRVPPDVREQAEKRKRDEEANPRRAARQTPLWEFLNFGDYQKIISSKQNWEQFFKPVFISDRRVNYVLPEINLLRNDIAHGRILPAADRDKFVLYAREILEDLIRANQRSVAGADQESAIG